MAGPKVPLTFRIFKGDQLVREERLSLSVIKLGKVPSAHLKLDDETVSRMHAIIEVNGPGDVSIIDLGSTKGTFVNGQKVNKAKLQSGDTIVVGETRIELSIGAGEEEDAPTRVQIAAPPETASDKPGRSLTPPVAPPAPTPPPAAGPAPMFGTSQPPPAPGFGPMSSLRPVTPVPGTLQAPVAPPPSPFAPAPAPSFAPPPPPAPPPPASYQASVPPPPAQVAPTLRPPPGLPGGFGTPVAAPAIPFGGASIAPAGFQQMMAESVDDIHGARAVEVAAMLGDSVVAVKHCIDPKGGKTTPLTVALFAIGLVTLLLSGFAFVTSVSNASANKAKLDYMTTCVDPTTGKMDPPDKCTKRPAHAFRPDVLSPAYDVMAFGGLAIALFAFSFGLVRFRNEKRSPWYRIGTASGVEFATQGAPGVAFPMIAPHGDDFVFNFGAGMEGEMILDGQSTPLADLAAQGRARPSQSAPGAMEVAIPSKARIRVRAGKTTFLVSAVPQPRKQSAPLFASMEGRVLAYFGGSLAAHLIIWAILMQQPLDDSTANLDLATNDETATRTNSTAQDDAPPPKDDEKPDSQDESGGSGTAMTLDDGKMGKKDSTRESGQYRMQKTTDTPELAREAAVESARTAGILGSSALTQGGAFASITGTGDVSSGFDDSNIYGGLSGNEAGEMNGGFGYGRNGFGPGGGGNGWGTIGTGAFGTLGHGRGTGAGYGVGGGRGGMRGRTAAVPTVSIGQPNANGDLDKAIIRRYIKRNIQKISYCYEKQLLAKPTLAGTVSTQFFISPSGTVQTASGSGVDPEVSSCVADVIKGIEFPKPKGGGGVQVNYPFTFRPAGQ